LKHVQDSNKHIKKLCIKLVTYQKNLNILFNNYYSAIKLILNVPHVKNSPLSLANHWESILVPNWLACSPPQRQR